MVSSSIALKSASPVTKPLASKLQYMESHALECIGIHVLIGHCLCPARWVSVWVTKLSRLSTVNLAMNGGLCTNILDPRDNVPPKLLPELVFAVNWGAIGEYWADGGNPT